MIYTMMPIDFKVVFILFILSIKWSDANDLRGTMVVGENGTENGIIVANRYPYFAMISGSEGSCGGALIAPDIVLSARNCRGISSNVMLGQGSAMETIRIKQRIFYPFNRNFDAFDLMMLKLNHTSIKPILKLRPNVTEGKTFGTIGLGQEITSDPQEVEFEYTDNDKCQEKHGWQYDIIGSHICAESSKDSCFFGGKGGSPLFIKGGSYEEDELVGVLIGAVYTGSGCADESYPSIYERTSFFYNWAVKTVCEVSENPPEYFGCPTKQPSSQPLSIAPTQYPSSLPSDFPSITPTQLPPNGDGSYFTTLEAQYVPITNQSPTLTSNVPSNGEFQSVLDSNLSPLSLATDELQFVTWDPIEPLKHCQGDCDRDADCAGNMICFKRSGSVSVPGCADSSGYVPSVSDFCYYEAPIDGSN